MIKQSVFVLVIALVLTGCSRKPDSLISPSLRVIKDAEDPNKLMVNFSGGIQNVNTDTAFLDIKGRVIFGDTHSLDFTIPLILPQDVGRIAISKEITRPDADALIAYLDTGDNTLDAEGVYQALGISEKKVQLDISEIDAKPIVELLKEKVENGKK